jgi:regulator of cell morphogenesis and NO signaling
MTATEQVTLAELVTAHPGAARVLESFRLDYCCGGGRSLDAACAHAEVDPAAVIAALEDAPSSPEPDWAAMAPADLVDHLEATHHRYLHEELPRLDRLAEKVASVHGSRHPELIEVLADLRELRDDLEPHLMKEERVLFPCVRDLQLAVDEGRSTADLSGPIRVMRFEHDRAGELLEQLREHTGGYLAPPDACASYRALYDGLDQLESDTHLHVHKENNLLFPAVEALGG